MKEKLTLPFVNKGKPFAIPDWTVEMHEIALAAMVEETKDMADEKRDKEFRYYVIYYSLKAVDGEVPFNTIHNLHPENIVELFTMCYNAGKIDIFFHEKKSKGKGK